MQQKETEKALTSHKHKTHTAKSTLPRLRLRLPLLLRTAIPLLQPCHSRLTHFRIPCIKGLEIRQLYNCRKLCLLPFALLFRDFPTALRVWVIGAAVCCADEDRWFIF